MNRVSFSLAALVLAACTEEPPPRSPSDPSGDPDAGAVRRSDAGPLPPPGTDAGFVATSDAGPPPASGACINAADQAAIPMSFGGKDVFTHAEECVASCVFEAAATRRACINDCVQSPSRVNGAISSECTGCIAIVGDCAITHCVTPCTFDDSSPACLDCLCGRAAPMQNCIGMFMECSGLTDDRCG
jgi:hypothetical protein